MPVAKVIEVSAQSPRSFEDAIEQCIAKASKSVEDIRGAWVQEMKVVAEGGRVTEYRVDMKVSLILKDCPSAPSMAVARGIAVSCRPFAVRVIGDIHGQPV